MLRYSEHSSLFDDERPHTGYATFSLPFSYCFTLLLLMGALIRVLSCSQPPSEADPESCTENINEQQRHTERLRRLLALGSVPESFDGWFQGQVSSYFQLFALMIDRHGGFDRRRRWGFRGKVGLVVDDADEERAGRAMGYLLAIAELSQGNLEQVPAGTLIGVRVEFVVPLHVFYFDIVVNGDRLQPKQESKNEFPEMNFVKQLRSVEDGLPFPIVFSGNEAA